MRAARRLAGTVVLSSLLGTVLACFGGGRIEDPDSTIGPSPQQRTSPGLASSLAAYEQAGLIAAGGALPFIGTVRYLAAPSADSTLLLVTLSLANRVITFASEGQGRRGAYGVAIELRRDGSLIQRAETHEVVRVASFRESARNDESIIFQHFMAVAPGQYSLSVAVKDDGSARSGAHEMFIAVPRLTPNTLSSPITIYEGAPRSSIDSIPKLIVNPRATVVFGRDSVVPVYLEGYGLAEEAAVFVGAFSDKAIPLWVDTLPLPSTGSLHAAVLDLPVSTVGVGRLTVAASLIGSRDTVRTPLFVSFGEDWAIASFEEMLSYLRYFATEQRLQTLREATAEARAAAWGAFYRDTDPDPRTPEHEGLRDYFRRIQVANERFREEGGPGWLTDRGRVYATLGDPDQVYEQTESSLTQRGRAQIWTYAQHRLQLVFIDQSGFGRWRLTASSEGDFLMVAGRERK
ncbi:MAG TPA: GWxTD domain-containing protein [Gemmatimonadaceae bacterium]|nr:GWxTD domain-containing protein [Gemmatimonadaceae bacterium]